LVIPGFFCIFTIVMSDKKEHIVKLEKITLSQQEIWQAMRSNVEKNKKKYTRKEKHKGENLT
jgi:hypothetical protein